MEWQAAEASVLLESVGVPPAALSRSSEGLTAHWPPWKRLGMADGMAFGPEPVSHGSGMTTMPWRSAPDAVSVTLKGWPHEVVPGQFAVDPRTSHG